jgi:23S rRNA pseudouridine1911/1915/1917 synthase
MAHVTHEAVCPAGLRDRLDKVLPGLFPELSRGAARRLIGAGAVFVDGRRCRVVSRLVGAGARVRVESFQVADATLLLNVLYDTAGVVAVDKPAGMPSAATRRAAAGTALETLMQQWRAAGRREQLWIVHRLDAATSGVLLFATQRSAAAQLSEAFRCGDVRKTYLALISGCPVADAGTISLPIVTDGARSRIDRSGKPARTDWRVLERRADTSLLEVEPHSGRMHQVRVHLQAAGHPVVGDRWYRGARAPRLMLHALRVAFTHPHLQAPVTIEAPWSRQDWA